MSDIMPYAIIRILKAANKGFVFGVLMGLFFAHQYGSHKGITMGIGSGALFFFCWATLYLISLLGEVLSRKKYGLTCRLGINQEVTIKTDLTYLEMAEAVKKCFAKINVNILCEDASAGVISGQRKVWKKFKGNIVGVNYTLLNDMAEIKIKSIVPVKAEALDFGQSIDNIGEVNNYLLEAMNRQHVEDALTGQRG